MSIDTREAVAQTVTETRTERQEALERLHQFLQPGDTVYTILRHKSTSGMSRVISLLAIRDNRPLWITWNAAKAMGRRFSERYEGIVIPGCGMDMGFALVYELGSVMWPNGTPEPHSMRNGQPDSDGGYALNHRWL